MKRTCHVSPSSAALLMLALMLALLLAGVLLPPVWVSEALALEAPPAVVPLTSSHIAVSWVTGSPRLAQVEYSQFPFRGPDPEGSLFPSPDLSATGYTPVRSLTHDLCLTDLQPDTLYFVRVRTMRPGGRPSVSQTVAVKTLPRPAPPPASEYTASAWMGLYATDRWMKNATIRANLMAAPHARGATLGARWADIESTPGSFDFSTIDRALLDLQVGGKHVKLALRGTANVNSKRIPDWAADGVETILTRVEEDRNVKWDPVLACRWWKFVTAFGRRYDDRVRGRLAFVTVSGVGSGEMATLRATLHAYRELGYTDKQIEANFLWAWRNTLKVFAEAFPHARLGVVPGSIPLTDQKDLGERIVRQAVETYGRRLVLSHSGFALDKGGFIIQTLLRYRDRVPIGGLTEQPPADSPDPVGVLHDLFEGLVFPNGFSFVTLHPDALGIRQDRWSGLADLEGFLATVEAWFAERRAP